MRRRAALPWPCCCRCTPSRRHRSRCRPGLCPRTADVARAGRGLRNKAHRHRIEVSAAASTGKLYAQVNAGAPSMTRCFRPMPPPCGAWSRRDWRAAIPSSTTPPAGWCSGAATPGWSGDGEALLRKGSIPRLAIANPALAPHGVAARDVPSTRRWQGTAAAAGDAREHRPGDAIRGQRRRAARPGAAFAGAAGAPAHAGDRDGRCRAPACTDRAKRGAWPMARATPPRPASCATSSPEGARQDPRPRIRLRQPDPPPERRCIAAWVTLARRADHAALFAARHALGMVAPAPVRLGGCRSAHWSPLPMVLPPTVLVSTVDRPGAPDGRWDGLRSPPAPVTRSPSRASCSLPCCTRCRSVVHPLQTRFRWRSRPACWRPPPPCAQRRWIAS